MKPRIRIDDVFQSKNFSYWQLKSLEERSMFEWFKLATSRLEDTPIILAVVAEGIDSQPEWVEYIKAHPKWEIQCHGWEHKTYTYIDLERMKMELIDAKQKIKEIFGCTVSKFYPPKMKYNDMTREAARQVGMEEARERWTLKHYMEGETPPDVSEVYIHHWSPTGIERLWQALADGSLIQS